VIVLTIKIVIKDAPRFLVTDALHWESGRVMSDTGIEIPAHHIPWITERFYRVDRTVHAKAAARGLGRRSSNTCSSGIRPSPISRAPWVKAALSGVIFPTRPSRLLSPRLSLTNLLENPSNGITKPYGITLVEKNGEKSWLY
jgi:hypothetical protein